MTMDNRTKQSGWVYLFVNNPGQNESFAGFDDLELGIQFIPTFYDKESALMCAGHFLDPTAAFEVQAIHQDDLNSYASQHSFFVFVLDKSGAILEKREPTPA